MNKRSLKRGLRKRIKCAIINYYKFMKIKLRDLKHKNGKIVAEITVNYKEIIRTKPLDSKTIANGKPLDSDYRTSYDLEFLNKYDKDYDYGKIKIKYLIFPGTLYSAFIIANFTQRIFLKLLFEKYMFQRMTGIKQVVIGVTIGVLTAVIGGLILRLFTC